MAQDKKNEGAQYVVDGAIYKCQYGSAPCQMQVLTNQRIFAQNKPIVTDQEVVFKVPTAPFVNCMQNPNKQAPVCTYANGKWDPNTTVQQGKLNALTEDSTMKCPMFAGGISCVFPGQVQGVSAGDFNIGVERLSNFSLASYVVTFPDTKNDTAKTVPAICGVSAQIKDFKLQAPIYVRSNEMITLRAYYKDKGRKTELSATQFVNWAVSKKEDRGTENPKKGKNQPTFLTKTFADALVLYKEVCSPFNIILDKPGIYCIEGGSNKMADYYIKQFNPKKPLEGNNNIPKDKSCSLNVEVLEHNRILDVSMGGDYIKGEEDEKDVYIIKNSSKIPIHVRTALALNEDEDLQLLVNDQRQEKCEFLQENSPLITLFEARPVAYYCVLKSGFFNNEIEKRVQVVLSSSKTGVVIEQKVFYFKVVDGYVSASITLEENKPVPDYIRPGTLVHLSVHPADKKDSIPDLKNAVWMIKDKYNSPVLRGASQIFKPTFEGEVTIELDLSKCNSVIKEGKKGEMKASYTFNVARNVIKGVNSVTPAIFYPGIPYSFKFNCLYKYDSSSGKDDPYKCFLDATNQMERYIEENKKYDAQISNVEFEKEDIGNHSLYYDGEKKYDFQVKEAVIETWQFEDENYNKINKVGFDETFILDINIPVWKDYQDNVKNSNESIDKIIFFLLNSSTREEKPIAIESLKDARLDGGKAYIRLKISEKELGDHYTINFNTSKLPEKITLTASLQNPPYTKVTNLMEKTGLKGHWTAKNTSSLILTTVPEVTGFFSDDAETPLKSVMKYGETIYIMLFTHNYKNLVDKLTVELVENKKKGDDEPIVEYKNLKLEKDNRTVKIDISDKFKDERAHGENPNPRLFYFRVKLEGKVVYTYPLTPADIAKRKYFTAPVDVQTSEDALQTSEDVFDMTIKSECDDVATDVTLGSSAAETPQTPVHEEMRDTETSRRAMLNNTQGTDVHQRTVVEHQHAMMHGERDREDHQRTMPNDIQSSETTRQVDAIPNNSQIIPATSESQQSEPQCDSEKVIISQADGGNFVIPPKTAPESIEGNHKVKLGSYLWQLKVCKDKEVQRLNHSMALLAPVIVGEETDFCNGRNCITRVNYTGKKAGKLIYEVGMRLSGFGGYIPTEEFTMRTYKAICQFQKDYMHIQPTGRICGSLLKAIDEFCDKYEPFKEEDFSQGKNNVLGCPCGKCGGFGAGIKSETKPLLQPNAKEMYREYEYPGLHRSLFFVVKAVMFYLDNIKSEDGSYYKFNRVYSAYRCRYWERDKQGRKGTNHHGKAMDLHFNVFDSNGKKIRCNDPVKGEKKVTYQDMDWIRKNIFVKCMHAQYAWKMKNKIAVEMYDVKNPISGYNAATWVHFDVREFDAKYKYDEYFVKTYSEYRGKKLVDIAKEMGLSQLCKCTSTRERDVQIVKVKAARLDGIGDRKDIRDMHISEAGLNFIKKWEKFSKYPYRDSEGYATIGYGMRIKKANGELDKTKYDSDKSVRSVYKQTITESQALEDMKNFIKTITEPGVKRSITVPLYQSEFDALVSLCYNTGASFLDEGGKGKGDTEIKININNGDYDSGCNEMADVTNHGTLGLIRRREAEMLMFLEGNYEGNK